MTFTDLVEKHKLVRRSVLIWAVWLITYVTLRVFGETPPVISEFTATAFGIVTAILATAIGFYKWSRHKENG